MNALTRTMIATALLCLWSAEAFAEIYACEGDDGVTSYQDQPCPAAEPAAKDVTADGSAEAETAPASPPEAERAPEESMPTDPELVAACKKRYRDAIDRLDAEIREGFAVEEREAYRERARALSQQLSGCEYGRPNPTSGDGRSEPAGGDL